MLLKTLVISTVVAVAVCNEELLEQILERLDHQQKEIYSLRGAITSLAKQNQLKDVESRKPVPEVAVYFSVSNTASIVLAPNTTVVYDDVISNAGGLYSADGRFTCPVGGYYYFHVALKSEALTYAHAHIVVDDGTTQTVIASVMATDGYGSSSNAVVVECAIGNTVYVMGGINGGTMVGIAGSRYNTFTGQLLWVL